MRSLNFGSLSGLSSLSGWLRLVRVPAGGTAGCVLSTVVIRAGVHWRRLGSVPCVGDDCPGCKVSRARMYGFVGWGVTHDEKMQRLVLELPAAAAGELEGLCQSTKSGGTSTAVELTRGGKSIKGRVAVSSNCQQIKTTLAVEEWEIWRSLAAVWCLPVLPDVSTDIDAWQLEAAAVCRNRLQRDPGGEG